MLASRVRSAMSRIRLLSVPLVGVAAMIIASEYLAEPSVTAALATIRAPVEGACTLANEGRIQNVANLDHARSGSSRIWPKNLSGDGAKLCGVSAGQPAFCITWN